MSVQHDIQDLLKKLLAVNNSNLAVDQVTLEICQQALDISKQNLAVNTANNVLLQQIVDDLASRPDTTTTSLEVDFGSPTPPV